MMREMLKLFREYNFGKQLIFFKTHFRETLTPIRIPNKPMGSLFICGPASWNGWWRGAVCRGYERNRPHRPHHDRRKAR